MLIFLNSMLHASVWIFFFFFLHPYIGGYALEYGRGSIFFFFSLHLCI